jgi:hypothetical protein
MWIVAAVVVSVIWACTGHVLFLFYRFLWQGLMGLLGFGTAKETPAATESGAVGEFVRAHGLRIVALGGAALAVLAAGWLVEDLVVDPILHRWVQFGALVLATVGLYVKGYRLRRRGPDTLGTGFMLMGLLLVPVDTGFYIEYILKIHQHNAYRLVLTMAAIAFWTAGRTGSRAFRYVAPQCLFLGVMLVADALRWPSAPISYLACLCAPLLCAMGLTLEGQEALAGYRRPFSFAAMMASFVALLACLDCPADTVPWLHLAVAVIGGGTLAVAAARETDLRGTVLVIPYLIPICVQHYQQYARSFGYVMPALAAIALVLLWLSRGEAEEPLRRKTAVPALFLMLFAVVSNGCTVVQLTQNLLSLSRPPIGNSLSPNDLVNIWQFAERSIFHLSRVHGVVGPAGITGFLAAAGLVFVAGRTGLAFFSAAAAIPLVTGAVCSLLDWYPVELHYHEYVGPLSAIIAVLLVSWRRWRGNSFGHTCSIALPLIIPIWYIFAGLSVYADSGIPSWYTILLLAVLGAQAYFVGTAGGGSAAWRIIGVVLLSLAWPVVLTDWNFLHRDPNMVAVIGGGLLVLSLLLIYSLSRNRMVEAVGAGIGLVVTLFMVAMNVGLGGWGVKLAVLLTGTLLLFLGSRSRSAVGVVLLALSLAPAGRARTMPARSQASLVELGAANPNDPIIGVRMRATGTVAPAVNQHDLWAEVNAQLATFSGARSAAAALQLAVTPLRLTVPAEENVEDLGSLAAPEARAVNYQYQAQIRGAPGLPQRVHDQLAELPADRIYLRFAGAGALGRVLDLYETRGQALLAVGAPGLSVPSPRSAFRRLLQADLVSEAADAVAGAISIRDPYLATGDDIALVLQMKDSASARERAARWGKEYGADRAAAVNRLAVLSCRPDAIPQLMRSLTGAEPAATLAAAEDFCYASLLDLNHSDGYLFVSEASVKHLVSPDFWLAAMRRADCLAEVADLEAALVYGRQTKEELPLEPEAARSAAVERRWMVAGRGCRSRGHLERDPDGAIRCSVHGNRHAPKSLAGEPITRGYAAERSAYRQFADRYRQLYARYIDPIAIGISVAGGTATLDTVVLPVARLPEYNSMSWTLDREKRKQPLDFPQGTASALAAVAFRFPPYMLSLWSQSYYWMRDPAVRRLNALGLQNPLGVTLGALILPGDWASWLDGIPWWKKQQPLPVVLSSSVTAPLAAREFLEELFDGQGHEARPWGHLYGNRLGWRFWLGGAVTQKAVLLGCNPAELDRLGPAAAEPGSLPGAVAGLRIHATPLLQNLGRLGQNYTVVPGQSCKAIRASLQNLLDLGYSWPIAPGSIPQGEPFPDCSASCPAGGTFAVSGGEVRCSIHDGAGGEALVPGSGLEKLGRALGQVMVEMSFEPEGIRTRLTLRSE